MLGEGTQVGDRSNYPPAVSRGSKTGRHYARLAELARASGFHSVTSSVIHSWVRHGLVPRLRYERPRFSLRVPKGVIEIERQLLALCALRYDSRVRSHHELALILWIDGWDVSEEVVRASLSRFLEPLAMLADPELRADFADSATRKGRLPSRWRRSQLTRTALALDTLFALISGARLFKPEDTAELAHLESVTGLDRGRTDRVNGVDPWLPTAPGEALAQGARGVALPRLLGALQQSTFEELNRARDRARRLSGYFAIAMPMMELAIGSGLAGFGLIADAAQDPRSGIPMVLVALELPEEAESLIEQLPKDEELAEWRQATVLVRELLAEDEELAARSAMVGVVAASKEWDAKHVAQSAAL
jgi:hypothetical protein